MVVVMARVESNMICECGHEYKQHNQFVDHKCNALHTNCPCDSFTKPSKKYKYNQQVKGRMGFGVVRNSRGIIQ